MWYKIQDQQVRINILAKPNAKTTAFLGINEQGLLISVHAKPRKGAANKELIIFLAELVDVPKLRLPWKKGKAVDVNGGRVRKLRPAAALS